jgi:hypothetical protein
MTLALKLAGIYTLFVDGMDIFEWMEEITPKLNPDNFAISSDSGTVLSQRFKAPKN